MLEAADRLVAEEREPALRSTGCCSGCCARWARDAGGSASGHHGARLLSAAGVVGRRLCASPHPMCPLVQRARTPVSPRDRRHGSQAECRPPRTVGCLAPPTWQLLSALISGDWQATADVPEAVFVSAGWAGGSLRVLAPGSRPAVVAPGRTLNPGHQPQPVSGAPPLA